MVRLPQFPGEGKGSGLECEIECRVESGSERHLIRIPRALLPGRRQHAPNDQKTPTSSSFTAITPTSSKKRRPSGPSEVGNLCVRVPRRSGAGPVAAAVQETHEAAERVDPGLLVLRRGGPDRRFPARQSSRGWTAVTRPFASAAR
ncbi:hypothetical protein GCM10010497_25900 [Streptomyces cinereoruber]|uniref:Uncharacterized protein n=1 Tax=Streptomyces cinereoruber TaxID=67260 RepID=A0AAV4KG92_9ACTN|nr:hypothetical protein [Streptomyces cinereoruber]NIH62858.1 hypothetical protein [Streptomyces cinereoruber]GGR22590.1 hypothetical protein GCM10010497_25900 [Streptomyces cinereoruber]